MLAVFASLYFGFDTERSKMSRYLEWGEGEKEGNQTTYSRMDQVKFLKVLKVFFFGLSLNTMSHMVMSCFCFTP